MLEAMRRARRAIFAALLATATGAALPQESNDDAATAATDDERELARQERLDMCVSVPAILDISVLTDAYVYVRTRGNHYLLATAECEDLTRSYQRRETQLVPYGRTLCQGDGSYVRYRRGGAERTCPISTIDRVDDRPEALAIAAGDRGVIDVETSDPAPAP
jgi:hypothetical protein